MPAAQKPDPCNVASLGTDLKALRKARGLTIIELSSALGRSTGWLSQIERGMTQPSISDLNRMAEKLNVGLSFFFGAPGEKVTDDAEIGLIVRAGSRRVLGTAEEGLIEELLSPDLAGSFEIIRSTFMPNTQSVEVKRRNTEEAAYLVSGGLEIWVDGTWHALNTGDSIRLNGQAHKWRNPYDQPAIAIWVITPPVY